jgi:hypothetical protein
MPKATWGSGDQALTAADIDGAERPEVTARYSGPLPPTGMYLFTIQRIRKVKSQNENPMMNVRLALDGSWRSNHKQFDGCPLWDRIPVMDSTKQRVANFLDAIGGTGKDLMTGTIVDEEGYITKLGAVGDPEGIQVLVNVKYVAADGQYGAKLETFFASYLPYDGESADPVEAGAADGVEPPF